MTVCSLVLALPIFPGRRQPSIFGAGELNFRVRDGNGWTLTAISTNFVDAGSVSFASALGESSLTSLHLLSDKSEDRLAGFHWRTNKKRFNFLLKEKW